MPKYDSLELGADSQLKYFAGYPVQGGTALTLPELNGSSVAVPITSTPLAASANFTGTTQDRLNVTAGATAVSGGIPLSQQGGVLVSKVKGSVYSDQAGTLYVEESNDNSTWTQTTTLAVSAGIFMDTGWVYLSKRYYRLRYANGATAQNTFALFQSVGAGQSDVQLMGSSATTIKNDAIPYGTTTNITYAGLPSYNKQIVVVVNNTNETITLTPAGGITTNYYESNYLSGNTIGQIPTFTVTAGQAVTLFNLPVAPENELSPSFTTSPTTGTYDVDIYLWRE